MVIRERVCVEAKGGGKQTGSFEGRGAGRERTSCTSKIVKKRVFAPLISVTGV